MDLPICYSSRYVQSSTTVPPVVYLNPEFEIITDTPSIKVLFPDMKHHPLCDWDLVGSPCGDHQRNTAISPSTAPASNTLRLWSYRNADICEGHLVTLLVTRQLGKKSLAGTLTRRAFRASLRHYCCDYVRYITSKEQTTAFQPSSFYRRGRSGPFWIDTFWCSRAPSAHGHFLSYCEIHEATALLDPNPPHNCNACQSMAVC